MKFHRLNALFGSALFLISSGFALDLDFQNGGFENGWAGWKHANDPGMGELVKEAAHAGETGLRVSDNAEDKGSDIFSELYPVEAGKSYTLSFWSKVASGGGAAIYVRFFDAGGKELRPSKDLVGVQGSDWKAYSGTFTAPDGSRRADLYIRSFLKSKGVFFFDDVSLAEGTSAGKTGAAPGRAENAVSGNSKASGQHPRILLTREEIPQILSRTKQGGEVGGALTELLARADKQLSMPDPYFYADYEKLASFDIKTGSKGSYEGYFSRSEEHVEMFGLLYLLTGEKKYGEACVKIVMKVAENYPAQNFPGFFYTRGFYLRAATYTYDWCYDVMTPAERTTLRSSIATWAKIFYDRAPRESWETWAENTLNQVWNWNAGISASLGIACLAILDETDDPARQWLFQATRQVENYYRFAIDSVGGAVEGPAYVGYGAAPTPYFIEALRRITGEDLFESTYYKKITDFIAHEALPGGGRILNICDSGYRIDLWQYFIYAARRAKDPKQAAWFYQSMTEGVGGHATANLVAIVLWGSPADRAVSGYTPDAALEPFGYSPWRGVMMSRTGWKKEDVLFTIHAQECTLIKHDQADKGQINFFAYGQDFLIDSGYGNDGDMSKSSGTPAHNLILIDGKGQSGGSVQAYNNGHLRDHLHTSAADFARVDMKDAYEFNFGSDYVKNKTRSMKKADRHALFARGSAPYLVVYDEIAQDDQAHAYSLLLHTSMKNAFSRKDGDVFIRPTLSSDRFPVMAIQPFGTKSDGAAIALNSDAGEARISADIKKSGRFLIYALTAAITGGQKSDSIFFSIDRGKAGFEKGSESAYFTWKTSSGDFEWTKLNDNNGTVPVPYVTLEKGQHEFLFRTREEGAAVLALLVVPAEDQRSIGDLLGKEGDHLVVYAKDFVLKEPMRLLPSSLPPASAEAVVKLFSSAPADFKEDLFLTSKDGAHPRLSATVQARTPEFFYAVLPYYINGKWNPAQATKSVEAQRGAAFAIDLPDGNSDLACRGDGKGLSAKGFESDAHFFWCRRESGGKLVAWNLSLGHSLKEKGATLFQADGEDVSAVWDGKRLAVSARDLKTLSWSGNARELFVNGIALTFSGNSWQANAETCLKIRQAYEDKIY